MVADHLTCMQKYTVDIYDKENEIRFLHKIIHGVASRSYGAYVAKMIGLPKKVIERAQEILDTLSSLT